MDGLAIGFCVLLLGAALLSDAGVLDRIVNGRRLVQLPLIYLAARLVPWSPTTASGVVRTLVAAAVGVSLFGLLEVSVAEAPIWRSVVPAAYYYHLSSESGLSATGTDFPIGGLPVIFYDFATGQAHRRLVSTFLEPTTVASFLALAAGIAAALGTVRRSFRIASMSAAFVIGLAAVLTLSKAGWLILGASIGYVIVASVFARLREPGWLISMAATLLGALIVVAVALQRTGVAQGPLAHFQGLEEGLNSALRAPLGLGVGFGGNFGASKLGAESTFGVTLVQLGWPGLVLWCGWLIGLVVAMATIGARVPGQQLVALAIGAALCGYLGTAALTESAGGLLGNWLYPWIAAAFVTVGAAQRSTTPPLGSDP